MPTPYSQFEIANFDPSFEIDPVVAGILDLCKCNEMIIEVYAVISHFGCFPSAQKSDNDRVDRQRNHINESSHERVNVESVNESVNERVNVIE